MSAALLGKKATAAYLGLSYRTFCDMLDSGKGPQPFGVVGGRTRWSVLMLNEWASQPMERAA